jgi:hypothetical protein
MKNKVEETFENFRNEIEKLIGVKNLQFVFPFAHDNLKFEFENRIIEIITEINNSLGEINFLENAEKFSIYLYDKMIFNKSCGELYGLKSSKYYKDVYNRLNPILVNERSKRGLENSNVKEYNPKKPVKNEFNKPIIKQKQVLLFMQLIKSHKLIISDIDDTVLSAYFEIMTGFSGEKLRQDSSKLKKEDIEYTKEDINQLKDILINMSKDLDKVKVKLS